MFSTEPYASFRLTGEAGYAAWLADYEGTTDQEWDVDLSAHHAFA
jgi:hypothetical protein